MASLLTASILVSLLTICFGAPLSSCPNMETLSPCTCKRHAYGLFVMCAKFNQSSHLTRAIKILGDYSVHTVVLRGLKLKDTLPSHVFDGTKIKELRVENSQITFSEPAFLGLDKSLNCLNIGQDSVIKSGSVFTLAKLNNLNVLNVESNQLKKVDDTWLNDKVPKVETVVLDYNEIRELENEAFAKLTMMRTISLSDNRIKIVKRSMFAQPATYLTRIDLSSNEIKTLPTDMFIDMPSLKEIVLSNNELSTLPQATWSPVWGQLTQILLFENKLICNEDMKWIKDYQEPYQFDGNCVNPTSMRGRSIKDFYHTT